MKKLDRNNPPEWAVGCFDRDVGFLAMEFFDTKDQAIQNWEWRNAEQAKAPWLPSQKWAVRQIPAIHCHRCGWSGTKNETQNADGIYCPKCPEHKDDNASLSVSSPNIKT